MFPCLLADEQLWSDGKLFKFHVVNILIFSLTADSSLIGNEKFLPLEVEIKKIYPSTLHLALLVDHSI